MSQVPTAPKDDTKTKAKPTPKPELKPTAKPEPKTIAKPEPKPEVLATARLEQRTSVQALEARVRTRAQTDGYTAAVAQQQKNDRALAQNLGPEKSRAIDQQVQSNLRDLSTPWGKDEALRKTKAQLEAVQSDPERMAVIERTVRTALPRDTTDTKDLRQRQEFVQSLARENQRDPKLRTMTQQTLLEEADLRLQKPGVAALTERPPRTTGDASAASDLQNAQVLATSALSGGDPEQIRATVSSSTPERAERLGRLLTTPVEVPSASSDGDSVRRRTLGNTLTSLGSGDTDASTRAFTRSVATNIQRADVPSSGERLATHDDKGPVLDALAKAWGHQVAPDDAKKAALHEKVLRRGLEHDATTPVKPEGRAAYVQGLLDDPANFAFARPEAVGLGSDRALQKTVADETTARWTELSPEARREASSQLDAAFQTRQGRDLLLSSQLPAELRAQYLDVFRRDPAARTDLNGALQRQNQAVYEASGRSQHQTYAGKSLENAVGASLGLTPDASAARDPKALDQALGSTERSFYTEGQSGEVVGHLSKRIREVAGTDTPELRVIPVQFASATSGSQSTAVYGVKDKSGRETFVDHQGRTYDSFDAWREQNKLPSGTYSYPDRFETGAGSRVVTADTPQTGKQEAWTAADLTVLGVGVASQLVQKIPHPVTIAAGTAGTGLALGYGAVRGGAGLHDQLQQGRSLNPITNPSTIPNYLDLASGVLPGVAQTTKSLAGLPAIARSPALTTALNNLGTGARALELSADAGQVGTALVNAAQNPRDPGALLNAALSSAFFAPRAFKTSQDLRQSLAKVPTPETPRQVTVVQPELGQAPTRRLLDEALRLDHGSPAQNSAAADTLNTLAQSRGFQDLPREEQARLLRYVAGTNTELSAPARAQLQKQLADPAFQSGSTAEQLERLKTFMREQPGLAVNVYPTPDSYPRSATAVITERTVVPSESFPSGNKAAIRYTIDVDGRKIPVVVASDPAQPGTYNHTVAEIRQALERMPKVSRDQVNIIRIDNAPSPWDAHWQRVFNDPNHRAYMGAGANGELNLFPTAHPQPVDYMTGAIVHETGHFYSTPRWGADSVNDPRWQNWRDAIASDGFAPSRYGKNNPSEDFSESLNLYAAVRGTPREAEIAAIMPQRFKMLDEIWEQQQ